MDTEKQRQRRCDDARLTESGNARSEQLLVVRTESLTNREWLPGELLSGMERRRSGWFLDMKYQTCHCFGRTFDLLSVTSINYACAVKNDTHLMCTVGVKVRMGFEP